MRVAYFTHSLRSCWNHGNAHFLRGVLRELIAAGHEAEAFEPAGSWSAQNLVADAGPDALDAWQASYSGLRTTVIDDAAMARATSADLVIVHEWNEPALVAALGTARKQGGRFTLLFHDTHHRAVSDPDAMRRYDLDGYDGVLAFGEALSSIYRGWGWGARVFTWHEAADTQLFRPPAAETARHGAVWIGNWGDGERTAELESFLLQPTAALGVPLDIYGVRYPDQARAMLAQYGAPWSNHCRSTATSRAVNFCLPEEGGGMCSSGLVEVTRESTSAWSRFASPSMSKRTPAARCEASGP